MNAIDQAQWPIILASDKIMASRHGTIFKMVSKPIRNAVKDPILRVMKSSGVKMDYGKGEVWVAYKLMLSDGERLLVAVMSLAFRESMPKGYVKRDNYVKLKDYYVMDTPTKADEKKLTRHIVVDDIEVVVFNDEGKEISSIPVPKLEVVNPELPPNRTGVKPPPPPGERKIAKAKGSATRRPPTSAPTSAPQNKTVQTGNAQAGPSKPRT